MSGLILSNVLIITRELLRGILLLNYNLRGNYTIRATSCGNVSSGIFYHVRLKPACAATEASYSLETLDRASIDIIQSNQRKNKGADQGA